MRVLLWICFFFLWIPFAAAQTIEEDSLLSALNTAPDTAKINILIQLCKISRYNDSEKSLGYGKKALALAKKLHDEEKTAQALINLSTTLRNQSEYTEALDKAFEALKIYKALPHKQGIGNALFTIGSLYDFQGNYAQAMDYLSQSLKIYLELDTPEDIAMVYNSIGIIYENEKNDSMALSYYHKAMDIYKKIQNPEDKPRTLNNIGLVLLRQNKYTEALDCFTEALKIIEKEHNQYGIALLTNNIGITHKDLGVYDKALAHFRKALKLQEKLGDKFGMAITLDNMGETHHFRQNHAKAIDFSHQSLELAQSIGAKEVAKRASETLSKMYQHQQNYRKAFKYQGLFMQYKDSLFNESKEREIGRLEADIALQLQQAENELLLKDNQLQQETIRQQRTIVVASFLFLVLLGALAIILYRSNRQKQKSNQLISQKNLELIEKNGALEELNREKNSLMSIVAHDMKSPLHKIDGLAQLLPLSGGLNAQQTSYIQLMREVVHNGSDLINELVEIEELSHNHIAPERKPVHLHLFIEQVIKTYQSTARQKRINICFSPSPHVLTLETDEGFLTRIMDNLLSNAIKFSTSGRKVYISYTQENAHAFITVKDEGPGISEEDQKRLFKKFQKLSARPTGGESSSGLGLSITKVLVEKLGGKITVESELGKGAAFCVELPLGN